MDVDPHDVDVDPHDVDADPDADLYSTYHPDVAPDADPDYNFLASK